MKSVGNTSALSPREDEVLSLAATGMTDQQIANTLGIRVSTVTTYWIRIRSKVGHLNRGELIAHSVSQQSEKSLAELRAEVGQLQGEKASIESELERKQATLDMAMALLDHIATGVLVFEPGGTLASANRVALEALGLPDPSSATLTVQDVAGMQQLRPIERRDGWVACIVETSEPQREKIG